MSILPDNLITQFDPFDKDQLRFYVKCPSDIAHDEEAYTHLVTRAIRLMSHKPSDYVVEVKVRDHDDDGNEYLEFTATPKPNPNTKEH